MMDIRDLLNGTSWSMAIVASQTNLPETKDLLAFGQLVLWLARKHWGMGWVVPNSKFRKQGVAGTTGPIVRAKHLPDGGNGVQH